MDWPMLRALGEEERRELLRRTRRRRFARNEILFHEGDPADSLHLLNRGRVSIRAAIRSGDAVTLAIVGTGTVLGEMALLSGANRRAATVTALEPTETLCLYQDEFDQLRREHPSVDRFLVELLAAEVRRLDARLLEALYVPAETRVMRRLLDLASLYQTDGHAAVIPLSQEVLASLAGTSRSTANQALRAAEAAGAIAVARSKIEILDLGAVEHRAR
jgi:CRP/FNR family transcriptional regulator, cyclic AMP receptor protein